MRLTKNFLNAIFFLLYSKLNNILIIKYLKKIVFVTGTVTVIYALVWFSIKREKWLSGNAAPIIAAVTAAIAIPSTAMATVVPHQPGNTKNHVEEQSVV